MPLNKKSAPKHQGSPAGSPGRDRVISSALELFEAQGFNATSIREIATNSQGTIGAIYHYFSSKDEILQEIMERVLHDAISATRRALIMSETSPSEQLSSLMSAWVIFHCTRQSEAIVGLSEIRSLKPAGRRLIIALRDEQESYFREVIERGCETGDFRTKHPKSATRALLNMGSNLAFWYDKRGPYSPEEMAEIYVDLALGTVRAPDIVSLESENTSQ